MSLTAMKQTFDDWHRPYLRESEQGSAVKTYVGVDESQVRDAAAVLAAKRAITVACADLRIAPPKVFWFTESVVGDVLALKAAGAPAFGHPGIRGIAHRKRGAIGISEDLSPVDAAETAAHECYHLSTYDGADDEADALNYGKAISRVYSDCLRGREPRVMSVESVFEVLYSHLPGDVVIETGGKGRVLINTATSKFGNARFRTVDELIKASAIVCG